MKKYITIILLTLAFIAFCLLEYNRKNESKVLEIVSPDTIVVDINKNGRKDFDETICVADVESYKFDINDTETIGFWYLANQFALKNLQEKHVKLNFTGEKTSTCSYAHVNVNNKDYGQLLDKNNFNINNLNEEKTKEQKDIINRMNLVIYNHKSKIVHKLDCKFGKLSHDAVILPFKQIIHEGRKCKYCMGEGSDYKGKSEYKKQKSKQDFQARPIPKYYPNEIVDGNFKLIISDHTNTLKPDDKCNFSMCKNFVQLINSSKSTIDIASYGFDNIPAVISALENAKKRGVKIRIVYDVNSSGQNTVYPETHNFLSSFDKNQLKNDYSKEKVKSSIIMHNKFAIFDKTTVFTGSMNFSRTGFSGFNSNSVLIINSLSSAKIFEHEFEQMFNGKFHQAKTEETQNYPGEYAIYFSPQDKVITNKIIPLVKEAQNYIYIPIFVITHEELTQALINAHNRGVDVKLITDATNAKISRSKVKILRKAGIPVKIENYAGKMHSKTIIIDDNYLILGSMNFSKSGENKNDENCVIIKNSKLTKFYKGFFEYMWTKIPDVYLKRYPMPESSESVGSCTDGVDNDFDGKIDSVDESCAKY